MDTPVALTPRQNQMLKAIIEEYIETAAPVGSETLDKKYSMGVSPATIRNEMVRLTQMKYLHQPHTSAGRSPTSMALRYYVEHLMKAKDISVAEEVAVKEKIWDYRAEVDKLLRETTKMLAARTKTLAVTATQDGDLYYAGAANILDMPEFYDFELTHHLLATLDQFEWWWKILEHSTDPFDIIIGEEVGGPSILSQCGFIYSKFQLPHGYGAIGIVGPSRLNYQYVIPLVRYVGGLMNEFATKW